MNPSSLNNTKYAEMDVLLFNRVAKVGSESLMQLLKQLAPRNNMKVIFTSPVQLTVRTRNPKQEREQIDWLAELEPGTVYIEHCNWLNFTKYHLPKPIYINLVRDPVERVISWFFYVRGAYKNAIYYTRFPNKPIKPEKWYKKDFNHCVRSGDIECQYVPNTVKDPTGNYMRQSLFFCGNDAECLPFDSFEAIQRAKFNVERDYAVVGSWEDANVTLTVFEHYVPRFFRQAKEVYETHYQQLRNRNRNNRKPKIDADVKAMIRKNFTHEYEFYYFCKQRLYKQYLALNIDKNYSHY